MNEAVQQLIAEQLTNWETARDNYAALADVRTKTLVVSGSTFRVQFNPARIVSSAAKVDPASIRERACFLCASNRPAQQQGLPFPGAYTILVNPFPIFPRHLTIPATEHTPQRISGRVGDMLELAKALDDYVLFYNGPKCGASAPDHMHFQAGSKGFLPFETEWRQYSKEESVHSENGTVWSVTDSNRFAWVIESSRAEKTVSLFDVIYNKTACFPEEEEPMMNVLAWYESESGNWIVCVFPRKKHRPDCFYANDETQLTISPASVDLGGVFITPVEKDFNRIGADDIASLLQEVCRNGISENKTNE